MRAGWTPDLPFAARYTPMGVIDAPISRIWLYVRLFAEDRR
jgi:hypothetical protein